MNCRPLLAVTALSLLAACALAGKPVAQGLRRGGFIRPADCAGGQAPQLGGRFLLPGKHTPAIQPPPLQHQRRRRLPVAHQRRGLLQ